MLRSIHGDSLLNWLAVRIQRQKLWRKNSAVHKSLHTLCEPGSKWLTSLCPTSLPIIFMCWVQCLQCRGHHDSSEFGNDYMINICLKYSGKWWEVQRWSVQFLSRSLFLPSLYGSLQQPQAFPKWCPLRIRDSQLQVRLDKLAMHSYMNVFSLKIYSVLLRSIILPYFIFLWLDYRWTTISAMLHYELLRVKVLTVYCYRLLLSNLL